jgi:hypothetical protein
MRGFRASLLAAFFVCLPSAMLGQAQSTASVTNAMPSSNFGFNLPSKLGTLSYSLNASEQIENGYGGGGGVYASTSLGGDLAYLSKSEINPFSLVYSGGVFFGNAPGTSTAEFYQNLAASQVLHTRAWVFVVSDSVSYLPNSPTTGLSGVAGVGDVGVFSGQGSIGPPPGILTTSSSRIYNTLEGSATWQATPSLDFEGSGNWAVQHFTGGDPGNNSNQISATVGPNYRIDSRNSVGASVYYSRVTYPSNQNYLIETQGVSLNYSRAWSRRLSTTFSFGPARTYGTTIAPIPSQLNLAGSAGVTYATRTTGLYASYDRSTNGGSGVIYGALTDSVVAGMTRPISRDWILGANFGYSHSLALAPVQGAYPVYNSIFGGVQLSRRLTESLSAYGSYTAISQSEKNAVPTQAPVFNGTNNVFSIGITFAPKPLLSGR